MRSIVVSQRGGPDTLALTEVPAPRPGPGEVLVDVTAAGVNFLDIYYRTGFYDKPLPFTPGVEGCGTVAAVGTGVRGFAAGDRVAWAQGAGSYAEQIVIPAERAVVVPDVLSDEEAATGLLHGMAARYLTTATYRVSPGDIVLVQGGTGGMRLLVAQLAKAKGAVVLVTVADDQGARVAQSAGADAVICPPAQDVVAEVRKLTSGAGVNVVYDGLGRVSFNASLACLRRRGTLVIMAELTGPVPPIDPKRLTAGSFFVTRPILRHHIERRAELTASAREVFAWIHDRTLRPLAGGSYPLEKAADAHRELEARRDTGKPLIRPGN